MIYEQLKHFNKHEAWGDAAKVDGKLLLALDLLRAGVNLPFLVNCSYTNSGHANKSFHYKGLAVDGYFLKGYFSKIEVLYKIVNSLSRVQIGSYGLGFYPWWKNSKGVGIHFDVRDDVLYWLSPSKGKYIYYKTAEEFLLAAKEYGNV